MFSSHVKKQFSAYCHNELPAAEARRVAEHLIGCTRCREEFEEIKLGVKFAEQLPLVQAPDSLWLELETFLDRQGEPAALQRRRPIVSLIAQPRFAVPAFAALLCVAFIIAVRFHQGSTGSQTEGASWEVARLDGSPRIGSATLGEKGKLGVGQWLETDASSRARIEVGDIGQVQIDPNTRIRLIETKATEHRLELAQGRLSARISAPPKLFFVNTPSGVAEDLGCAYTLEVDDQGNSLLRVTLGWVALQLKDRESLVPAGAACATRPGVGPGTPYFEDASESFRNALTKLDFEPSDAQVTALNVVLHDARPRDTFTLWHLLSRVNGADRARVYDRMAALVPPPKGVTRDGVLRLDQQMLNQWRDEIDAECQSLPEAARYAYFRVRNGVHRRLAALRGK
jgi:FecR protein/Putative zinc-finger